MSLTNNAYRRIKKYLVIRLFRIKIIFCIFAKQCQDIKSKIVLSERIKELRIQKQMPQRQLALNIDTATYCKIERGERKAKKEQVPIYPGYLM